MNEPTEPLAGYGTHLRRSRDELVAENEKLLARATKEMLDHETTKARVEQLEAENRELRDNKDIRTAQVAWYRAHGKYSDRILKDSHGVEYVIGDQSWESAGRNPEPIDQVLNTLTKPAP